jgi:hypothetical protein
MWIMVHFLSSVIINFRLRLYSCPIELRNLTHKMWCRYRYCFARRRSTDGSTAPSLPEPPGFSRLPSSLSDLEMFHGNPDLEESQNLPYPGLDPYSGQAQALAEMQRRNEMLARLPKAAVSRIWERKKQINTKA